MPKGEELAAPNDYYLEIEVAQKHGGWYLWEKLPVWRREQLIAHHLHEAKRNAYYRERIAKYAKRKAGNRPLPGPEFDPLAKIKEHWKLDY